MQVIHGGMQEGGSYRDSPTEHIQGDTATYVVFSIAGEILAVNVDRVKEIIRVPTITWVPGSVEPAKGVISLRGAIVPVLELAGVLSLQGNETTQDTRIIIVETGEGTIGMLVDSVNEVADVSLDTLEPSIQTLTRSQKKLVREQMNHRKVLVGILDLDRVIEEVRP